MATVTTGLATSFITFSRPSASGGGATVTDRDGKIKWAGHNLLSNSESFDASSWTKSDSTVSANVTATTAPNGTNTADKIAETATTAAHRVQQPYNMTAGTTVTLSVFAKAAERSWLQILTNSIAAGNQAANFDLTNGVIGTGALGTALTKSMAAVGNGWYFCSITWTPDTTGSNVYFLILTSDAAVNASYAGTAGNGIFLWGAHLYRSDMGMQQNPAMPAGMGSYYPTTPRNLLGYTEDFATQSASAWQVNGLLAFGSGSVSNSVVAPNGLQTADLITPDTANSAHRIFANAPSVSSTKLLFACYAKSNGYTKIGIRESGTTGAGAAFDLSGSGSVIGAYDTGGSTVSNMVISSVGDGWFRISCVISFASATAMKFGIHILSPSYASGALEASWTPNGTSGIYLWGAQLSASASLDAYSPVYGAAVTSAAYYAPRLDFDSSGVAKGLLVEEARTNLLTYSNAFDDTNGWTTGSVTVTANTAVSPDGLTNADAILEAAVSTKDHQVSHVTAAAAGTYTLSCYIKPNGRSWAKLALYDNGISGYKYALFDVSTGATGTADTGVTSRITTAGNGWYRCSATYTSTGTVVAVIQTADGNNNNAFLGDVTKGLYVYGAQLEAGSFATSCIPTGSATATRGADVASVSVQAFPYSGSEGTIVVSVANMQSAGAAPTFVSFDDGNGGYDNVREIYLQGANGDIIAYEASSNVAAVNSVVIYNGSVGAAFTGKVAYAYKANDFDASYNGNAAASLSTSGTPAANISRMGIGTNFPANANGATGGQSHIRQITYLPRKLTDAELAARSA